MKKILLLVSVFVLALALSGCVTPAEEDLTCTAPQVLNDAGDACVDPEPDLTCTAPQVLNEAGDECVDPEVVCGEGEYELNGECAPVPVCADDEELNSDYECVALCEEGFVYDNEECIPEYEPLDPNAEGRIDLLLWSGTGTYWEDLGNQDLIGYCPKEDEEGYDADCVADLTGQNDAAAYAVAKMFNEMYPNVEINVLAIAGGPNDGGKIWSQELENYRATYGAHPSVWASVDLPGDVSKGIVADLSRFQYDPVYRSMNPSILNMMNYYGFQAGLPQYILPWGIYVNKELALYNNITVPGFDWTIDEYTTFIANSDPNVYYGSMDTPMRIIETATNDVNKMLFEYDGGDEFVDLDSDEVRSLIPYINQWNENSVWGNWGEGLEITQEFMDANWWWSYVYFMNGTLLTLEGDPWMMGDCAHPSEDWWGTCKSDDWDIYPRPSTDYVDNTVGIVLDPMAVYNFCIEDGNLACSEEEELQIKISYTFASFWIASSESFAARAEQVFSDDDGNKSSALNDSFPVTSGDLFDEQMQVWYTPLKHQRFSDPSVMPGFHEVIRIYEAGQFWDVSDKSYPYFHNVEGSRRENLYEWKNYWNPEVTNGANKGEPEFTDLMIGNLYQWNVDSNARFAESFEDLRMGLSTYYGYSESDFE
jgi:hypothetical protein